MTVNDIYCAINNTQTLKTQLITYNIAFFAAVNHIIMTKTNGPNPQTWPFEPVEVNFVSW